MNKTSPKVIVVQPAVPSYRLGFFDRIAEELGPKFLVYASWQDLGVLTKRQELRRWERKLGPIKKIFFGIEWQVGVSGIHISRGDVLVISGAPRCVSNIALMFKARIFGARVVWWGHYWSPTSQRGRAALRFKLMKFADCVLLYTDSEITEFKAHSGQHGTQLIAALNNGIETDKIKQFRVNYSAEQRPRDILFIGRLTYKSKLDLLIEMLSLPGCSEITLDIIGAGEAESFFRETAKVYGVSDRITWHKETVDESEIALVANQCKLFSYPGAVGLSLIHAMSYGLPVILNDSRWLNNPEYAALNPGVNGWKFLSGSSKSLGSVIMEALSDHVRLNKMSEACIELTESTFNCSDMAQRFCRTVKDIGNVHRIS